jgi:hypothetical protein
MQLEREGIFMEDTAWWVKFLGFMDSGDDCYNLKWSPIPTVASQII